MADVAKMLAARKAAALEAGRRAQEAAEREAAEIDRDLKELSRITEKYGLAAVAEPAVSTVPPPAETITAASGRSIKMAKILDSHTSATMRSRLESAAVIRELNRPVPLNELYERISKRGAKLGGKKPAWVLSAVLGRTEGFVSYRDRGWWLKELGDPPMSLHLYEDKYRSSAEH